MLRHYIRTACKIGYRPCNLEYPIVRSRAQTKSCYRLLQQIFPVFVRLAELSYLFTLHICILE